MQAQTSTGGLVLHGFGCLGLLNISKILPEHAPVYDRCRGMGL